jgi:dephospho-CoA kinase
VVRVALTGGIATGKTTVLRRFQAHGVPVIDADLLARDAVAPGSAGLRAVEGRFGKAVVGPDGAVDRHALGRIVFADRAARADLEAIIHPAVYAAIERWFAGLPTGTPVAVADIPLLFETGRAADFDRVVVAACPPEQQLERVMARDGITEADAQARVAAQWPIHQKVERADHVIWTTGTLQDTERQVDTVLDALRSKSGGRA